MCQSEGLILLTNVPNVSGLMKGTRHSEWRKNCNVPSRDLLITSAIFMEEFVEFCPNKRAFHHTNYLFFPVVMKLKFAQLRK